MLKAKNILCVFALALVALSSCGSDKETLLVSDIDDAVAAVAKVLGKTPEFYEINATPSLVNLFAADGKGNAINFVYENGELDQETTVASAVGESFPAEGMSFNGKVIARVEKELPDSILRAFSIINDHPNGGVQYRVVLQSDRGGQFAVFVEPTGKILGTDVMSGLGT
ncbi:MAG: hypothetical protein NWP73_04530 [Ilumatobacteraceae bacterium]|jgi:hypothetical protein|nr:hypothetical protein [Ilumatobacteraceae bacterium]MDP4701662.1 hypothetical protein [Ilumatobacteraceae bacterium]MDP5109013.1 hypothetical protein [Ilumatobacteraceae bacterium]